MVLNLDSDLETVLIRAASREGITVEELAIKALKDR